MAIRPWTHEELLLTLNLYCKLPYSRFTQRTPEVIELARAMNRTPSSISMRLCNFASLDPELKARGIVGLDRPSKESRLIWEEFSSNWELLAIQTEELMGHTIPALTVEAIDEKEGRMTESVPFCGATEKEGIAKLRIAQNFFRRAVMASYQNRCCITNNPVTSLLTASHIVPWSAAPEHRVNPRNGLCLAHTQHAAFDAGLITFDEDCRLLISARLEDFEDEPTIRENFSRFKGERLRFPDRFAPQLEFINYHRENIYQGSSL